jgi:hypothetical protein
MKFLVLLAGMVVLYSCKSSALKERLSVSDSLVVEFYHPNTDSIKRTVQTTQKHSIDRMIDFVDTKSTEQYKCGYDGNIIFFAKGRPVLPMLFKFKEDSCRHFVFELDGKLMSSRMKNEAKDFLESLEAGKDTY